MATAGIIAFVILLIAAPIFIVNRDRVARRVRRRRHQRSSALPFLFFPTRDSEEPLPAPAWNGRTGALAASRRPAVQPEPGIADLPPKPRADDAEGYSRDRRHRRAATDGRASDDHEHNPRADAPD